MTAATAPTPTIAAEGAISDEVLQAARAIVERRAAQGLAYARGYGWQDCGIKNPPLLTLLDMLIGACEPVANAIADNCNDDDALLPFDSAKGLADALQNMADTIRACGESRRAVPMPAGWSLPSMTGADLI